jgi:hypothetical protein
MGAEVWYGGVHLSSEIAIPELDACGAGCSPNLSLQITAGGHPSPGAWTHQWLNDSGVVLSVAKFDHRYLLEFEEGRSFMFDSDTRTVSCPEPVDAAVRHELLDQVLPRVLEHLGHTMIHASTVRTSRGAVMFVADTGVGKSTLAASFQTSGVELLSDDCVRLITDPDGTVGCIPTYRSLRLWSDSADAIMASEPYEPMSPGSDKRRLGLVRAESAAPTAVAAICVLATADYDRDEITFSPVTPARAVGLLLAQCFRLDPTDADSTMRTFERCADVVERVPVVELAYPHDYGRLPEVRDAVLERAATGQWTSAIPT